MVFDNQLSLIALKREIFEEELLSERLYLIFILYFVIYYLIFTNSKNIYSYLIFEITPKDTLTSFHYNNDDESLIC